jgi:predicted transcriptional regulator of viral defense system
MDLERAVHDAAMVAGGWITRERALALGLTPRMIEYRVSTGRWLHRAGAYQVMALPGTVHLRRAAVEVLPGAVLSHQTAAEMHGLRPVERDTVVVTVHARTTHVFPGVTVHRTGDLAPRDVTVRDTLPITTPARTIVDLAGVMGHRQLAAVLDAALLERLVGYEAIVEVAERVCRRGKRGSAVLRRLLDERGHGLLRSATALERLGLKALGLTRTGRWFVQHPVPWAPGRRFDAAFPEARVAVEWDSRRWHTAVEDFRSDRERDRAAILNGWVVLRFTWHELEQDPWAVAGEIDRVVETRETP